MHDSPERVIARSSSSPTDQIVEAMAMAICIDMGDDPDSLDGGLIMRGREGTRPNWEGYESTARAALSALSSQGWAVVPKDQTARECWDRINALIVQGPLPGQGTDPSAQRNGLVLACNAIIDLAYPFPDSPKVQP